MQAVLLEAFQEPLSVEDVDRPDLDSDGGADVSADALGIATTCDDAVNSLRKGGTHLQIGLTTSEEPATSSSRPTSSSPRR